MDFLITNFMAANDTINYHTTPMNDFNGTEFAVVFPARDRLSRVENRKTIEVLNKSHRPRNGINFPICISNYDTLSRYMYVTRST